MKFAHARFTTLTGNLKMRMRATLDFGTFSAPLRAPEAEAQTPNESTCTVGRQSETRGASRVWRCGQAARARVRPDRDSTSTKRQPVYTTDVRQETLSMRTEPLARLCTAIRITRRQRAHATHPHTHTARQSISTAILKLRLRATLDFGTFSAPLRLSQHEAKYSMTHAHAYTHDDIDSSRRSAAAGATRMAAAGGPSLRTTPCTPTAPPASQAARGRGGRRRRSRWICSRPSHRRCLRMRQQRTLSEKLPWQSNEHGESGAAQKKVLNCRKK